jgi:hypothetical protein
MERLVTLSADGLYFSMFDKEDSVFWTPYILKAQKIPYPSREFNRILMALIVGDSQKKITVAICD